MKFWLWVTALAAVPAITMTWFGALLAGSMA